MASYLELTSGVVEDTQKRLKSGQRYQMSDAMSMEVVILQSFLEKTHMDHDRIVEPRETSW